MRLTDEQRMLRHLTRIWLAYLAVLVWLVPVILLPALSVTAQNSGKIPRIGYIWFGAEDSDRATRPGLQQGLRELG
jgi:hypothetical protein